MYDKYRGVAYWVFGSTAAMVIGAFGPWVTALGISVSGTDGSNDGWLVVGAAALGVLLFWSRRDTRAAAIGPVIGGVAGLGITFYDRQNVQHKISKGGAFVQALAHVGWGLNLSLVASLSMLIAGAVWWNRTAEAVSPATASSPLPPFDSQ